MKRSRLIILILALCVFLSSCSTLNLAEDTVANQDEGNTFESYMPLYFNNESQLTDAITTVSEAKKMTGKIEDTIVVDSKNVGNQSYDVQRDVSRLESVTKYYKPSTLLKGMAFSEIIVKQEYISFHYDIGSEGEAATFTWLREMSPEVAMNELYGRGAISERELEYNEIKYVFLEWSEPKSGRSEGYSIHWVVNNIPFQASVPTGYTDEEMLEFCHWEMVTVK